MIVYVESNFILEMVLRQKIKEVNNKPATHHSFTVIHSFAANSDSCLGVVHAQTGEGLRYIRTAS